MSAPIPRPGPDKEQPPGGALGQGGEQQSAPGWAWVEGSADTGPVPLCDRPGPQPEPPGADGLPAGLDYAALVEGLAASGALGGDQDAEFAEWEAAEAEGRLQPADPAQVAAQAVEHMPPGAAQAAWLEVAAGGVGRLDEYGLVGVTLAAGAQEARAAAAKLSAIARLCAATAAADRKIGLRHDGRPARVSRDAVGQIENALLLTHYQAEDLADLAVTLTWRLTATGQALAAGAIDLDRVKLIAQATSVLSEEQARAVEAKILPTAGGLTRPFLRDRLARAVINADPSGAEKRREQAERQAKVGLYGDPDGTATLAGSNLPAVYAAAAMARITAIARAMKAAGQVGGLNFHRAQVMIGLLLGTLPPIPPAEGAPPDQPSPDDVDPSAADEGPSPADDGGAGRPTDTGDGPTEGGSRHDGPDGCDPDDRGQHDGGEHDNRRWDDLPAPRDEDAPPDDGLDDNGPGPQDRSWDPAEEDDDISGPVPAWPALGAIPPALARRPAGPSDGRPVAELLDALLPWTTLAGLTDVPGTLGRIGPITAAQARLLAQAAQADPAAQWRVIVTNPAGQAIAVTRIRRPRRRGRGQAGPDACRDGPGAGVGLVGRITVTVTEDAVAAAGWQAGRPRGGGPPARAGPAAPIAVAALQAAARALEQARVQAREDQAAGGCAHHDESPAYRPPSRLREYVIARDVTCRSPVCRQPAWRADLDHTRPWAPGGQGGRTCGCNLGGRCRRDHQLKQNPRWRFEQTGHGVFRWTTPAGRTYEVSPDPYPV